jgi:hypothetical protein
VRSRSFGLSATKFGLSGPGRFGLSATKLGRPALRDQAEHLHGLDHEC